MRNFFCLALLVWVAQCHGAAPLADQIWEKLHLPKAAQKQNLHGVYFVDAKQGWIVGDKGLCLKTNDGGATWELKETGSQATLRAVQFRDAQTGWICGDGDRKAPDNGLFPGCLHLIIGFGHPVKPSTLLHTTDGGKTWKTSWIPVNFQIQCLEASAAPWIQVGTSGGKRHLDGDFLCSSKGGGDGIVEARPMLPFHIRPAEDRGQALGGRGSGEQRRRAQPDLPGSVQRRQGQDLEVFQGERRKIRLRTPGLGG